MKAHQEAPPPVGHLGRVARHEFLCNVLLEQGYQFVIPANGFVPCFTEQCKLFVVNFGMFAHKRSCLFLAVSAAIDLHYFCIGFDPCAFLRKIIRKIKCFACDNLFFADNNSIIININRDAARSRAMPSAPPRTSITSTAMRIAASNPAIIQSGFIFFMRLRLSFITLFVFNSTPGRSFCGIARIFSAGKASLRMLYCTLSAGLYPVFVLLPYCLLKFSLFFSQYLR